MKPILLSILFALASAGASGADALTLPLWTLTLGSGIASPLPISVTSSVSRDAGHPSISPWEARLEYHGVLLARGTSPEALAKQIADQLDAKDAEIADLKAKLAECEKRSVMQLPNMLPAAPPLPNGMTPAPFHPPFMSTLEMPAHESTLLPFIRTKGPTDGH